MMGHEIAHALARHSAEKLTSTMMQTDFGIMAVEKFVLGNLLDFLSLRYVYNSIWY